MQSDSQQTQSLCERLKKSLKAEKDQLNNLQQSFSSLESEKKLLLEASKDNLKAKQQAEAALQELMVALESTGKRC